MARNRAKVLFDYIVETYSIPASIITILPERHQTDKDIYSTFPDSIPCIDIASIRNTNKPINISQLKMAFSKLDGVENGANWKWFDEHVLAPFRFAEISISFNRHLTNDVRNHTIIPTEVMPIQQQTLQSNMRQSLDLQIQPTIISSVHYKSILLKNNLIYDLGLVANLGAEFSIGNHYSIDIPVTFSPYNITKTIRCRSLIVQPALRYWFKENLIGMFVSLYGHYGYYDVALDGKTRWQNSWNDPMYGGGAGFGFAKRFGRDNRYGIEVEVGLGYAYLPSNFYYNIPNGAWYDFSAKHYWGPTKVNVGFSYDLSHKIRKPKGKLLHK
ncbi:MAG: DUF3575 domain-containing protein [Prevotellaceae bacterium]|nr:DUF3575 domain-containing protein [Candidatus Colivivens equi]